VADYAPETPTDVTSIQQSANQAASIATPTLPLGPGIHPHSALAWTDLVQEGNGTYKQTAQHPELNACLSSAIRRATANLVLVDAFPSLHTRDAWALESLKSELSVQRNGSNFINAVASRAEVDEHYLNCLLSMVIPGSRTRDHTQQRHFRSVGAGVVSDRESSRWQENSSRLPRALMLYTVQRSRKPQLRAPYWRRRRSTLGERAP